MVKSELKIGKIENDTSCLNLHLTKLKSKNEDSMCRIVKLEAAKLENNIIIWNYLTFDIGKEPLITFLSMCNHKIG